MRIIPGFVHAGLLSDRSDVELCECSLDRGEGAPVPPLMPGGGVCEMESLCGLEGKDLGERERAREKGRWGFGLRDVCSLTCVF